MAESVQTEAGNGALIYRRTPKSMVSALALLIAGLLTFVMGMNTVYFVEAMAWTFLIWGALMMYNHLTDLLTEYIIEDDALIIRSPLRFWGPNRVWKWSQILRMDILVKRVEADEEDLEMQIYHQPEGTTQMNREDLGFVPDLAQVILDRASLNPERGQAMQSLNQIPQDTKATYRWSK